MKTVKCKLRAHFSTEIKGEVVVGPKEVEMSEEQFELEKHKFESQDDKVPKKEKTK